MKDETILGVVAIGGIVVLEAVALYQKIDGTYLSMAVAAIAAIAGGAVTSWLGKRKNGAE
jgi:hypothetical protein